MAVSGAVQAKSPPKSEVGAKAMSMQEAMAFENKHRVTNPPYAPVALEPEVYAQALNKKEACLVPMTKELKAEPNFKSYWDGQCKDGYAYGLGRDIAVTDSRTVEEITVYGARAAEYDGRKAVFVDYEDSSWEQNYHRTAPLSSVYYAVRSYTSGGEFKQSKGYREQEGKGSMTVFHALAKAKYPVTRMLTTEDNIGYSMNSVGVVPNHILDYTIETITSGADAPFRIFGYKTGEFVGVTRTGEKSTIVVIPAEYRQYLMAKLTPALELAPRINRYVAGVQEMEDRYLAKACAPSAAVPEGIPANVYHRICLFKAELDKREALAVAADDAATEKFNQSMAEK